MGDEGSLLMIGIVVLGILAIGGGLLMMSLIGGRRSARQFMAQVQATQAAAQAQTASNQAAALVDRGVALMAQFEPLKAEGAFAAAERIEPGFIVRLDRAIAVLNQSEPGAQEGVIPIFEALISEHPEHPEIARAHYCLGLAFAYLGRPEQALPAFERASGLRPSDGAAHYQVAQALEQLGRLEEALPQYERALALDPFKRSALLGLQRVHARAGREDEAAKALERFLTLEQNPRSRLTEFKYTRMGPLSEVIPLSGAREEGAGGAVAGAPRASAGPVLAPPTPLLPFEGAAGTRGAGIPIPVDLDADGFTDLFVAGGAGSHGRSVFLRQDSSGGFERRDNELAAIPSMRFASFADYDNDGGTDALIVTNEPSASRLMRRGADGSYAETARWGEANDALWVDLDHDGDLDLLMALASGTPQVLMNRGSEGFESLPLSTHFPAALERCVRVAAGDLNGDGMIDIVFVGEEGCQVWLQQGPWSWRRHDGMATLENAASRRMIVTEMPATGEPLVLTLGQRSNEPTRLEAEVPRSDPGTRMAASAWVFRGQPGARTWSRLCEVACDDDAELQALDFVGDGTLQLIVPRSEQVAFHRLDGRELMSVPLERDGAIAVAVAGGEKPEPALVEWSASSQQFRTAIPGPWRGRFVAVDFRGRTDPSQSMRSNTDGIGTRWAARTDGRWNGGWVLRNSTGPGQGRQPVLIGVGRGSTLDALFIDWPDGVIQSEMGLEVGAPRTVVETQRQISSCPVIFAWNGTRFEFETDCLGVGGLGYMVGATRGADGVIVPQYAPPRPRESVRIRGALKERDGAFELRLTEPMEEACYLDAARLVEWRIPEAWRGVLDERMAINGPEPTGAMRFYRTHAAPIGQERLIAEDHRALEFGDPHPRFIGRLREEGAVTLVFERAIDSHPGHPALVIDGWVEYPYSQTSFAMWQEQASPRAPSIDALDPVTNEWVTLVEEIGYPAGMTREALLPLTGEGIASIPPGCTTLRIRTSVELYIDRLRLVWLEPCAEAVRTELPLHSAEVAECGFPRRIELPQKRPSYDYHARTPLWDCRVQPGFYTRLGDCTELLRRAEGALAIFGPGEEIRLRFDAATAGDTPVGAPFGAPDGAEGAAPAFARVLVLEVEGWCKDMDRYTRDGARLEPLPEREGLTANEREVRDALHRAFNTRLTGGR